MASYKYTFTSGATVTPARLNDARDVFDIVNADIKSNAAIAHSKLANITSGQVLLGNASNVPTATAVTGDVTISNTGVTAIGSGVIVNADVNNNAAILGTKIAPDFGSQNVTTTGTLSAAAGSVISGSSSSDALRITQAGAGNALVVEDSSNPDSTPFVINPAGVVVSGHTSAAATIHDPQTTTARTFISQVHGPNAPAAGQALVCWNSTASGLFYAPNLVLARSASGTVGTLSAVSNNMPLGAISFSGDDGTAFVKGARIEAYVDGTPGTNDMPSRLAFSTSADGSSSPTERMRIDSAGNVGIANTAPTEKLHVTGNIKASGYIDADTSFRGQSSDSAAAPSFTWTDDTNTGMFRPAADTLAFCEGGVEAMRISNNGSILIGTTTPIDTAQGSDDGATFFQGISLRISSTGNCILLRKRSTNGNIMSFSRDTTTVGTISVTTTATAYNTSSDYRLKENPIPLVGGLATVDELKPCEFTWKSDGSIGRGFIAHELQAVVPEAVTGEKDAVDADGNPQYQGVDAAKLVPYLVSAVQELKARVEALEAA